jgi:4-amino-4-deoxy-L-arabinose transferase-like glycosyltransferase
MGSRWRVALRVATVGFALLGTVCLGHTRRALSGTFDEGNHLAAGLEWWQFGTYTLWTENPPLARLAVAAVPYFYGMRLPPRAAWEPKTHNWDRSWEVGTDLLYAGDGFERNLSRARLGTLPFFWLALASVWGLAGGRRRPAAGLVAVALTSTLPALIAHGALATTDVAFAGTFLLATLALWRWFETPTKSRALAVGTTAALALLCKFSTLLFFPAALPALCLARRLAKMPARPLRGELPLGWRACAGQLALAALAGLLVTWAGYHFSIGRMDDLQSEVTGWLTILPPVAKRRGFMGWLIHARLPMPELFHGLRFLAVHNHNGHNAYLLGKVSEHGFRAFYPIAFLVKTPLPFILLLLVSLPAIFLPATFLPAVFLPAGARRRPAEWQAAAAALTALGILLVSLPSHVNLGIRHVFVVLPLLAVAIGRAIGPAIDRALADRGSRPHVTAAACLGALLLWQGGIALVAWPRELGYFNALAGAEPANVLLDSDLDWGQDLFELRRQAQARGIDSLQIAFFGMLRLCQHGLPRLEPLVPWKETTGWIAISENYYRARSSFRLLKDPCNPKSTYPEGQIPASSFAWLQQYSPVAIVGSSIRLYHLPPR